MREFDCHAIESAGVWEAVCPALDLSVQGRSLKEVQAMLEEAVQLFVAAVMEEAPADRDKLLNRLASPAPPSPRQSWRLRIPLG